jgi:hypothetical protein
MGKRQIPFATPGEILLEELPASALRPGDYARGAGRESGCDPAPGGGSVSRALRMCYCKTYPKTHKPISKNNAKLTL